MSDELDRAQEVVIITRRVGAWVTGTFMVWGVAREYGLTAIGGYVLTPSVQAFLTDPRVVSAGTSALVALIVQLRHSRLRRLATLHVDQRIAELERRGMLNLQPTPPTTTAPTATITIPGDHVSP